MEEIGRHSVRLSLYVNHRAKYIKRSGHSYEDSVESSFLKANPSFSNRRLNHLVLP